MGRWDNPCQYYLEEQGGECSQTPTRRYIGGYRCREHTPSALAGWPEPTLDTPGSLPVPQWNGPSAPPCRPVREQKRTSAQEEVREHGLELSL